MEKLVRPSHVSMYLLTHVVLRIGAMCKTTSQV